MLVLSSFVSAGYRVAIYLYEVTGIFLLLCFTWDARLITAQEANITIPPRAVNVSIYENKAEFTCTGVGNSIVWRGNGQPLNNGVNGIDVETVTLNNTLNTIMSTLSLPVSSTDDATNITCIAVTVLPDLSSITAESRPALLMVQGPHGPISDLTVVSINSTTVLISWSPPFTLEGVPILGYNVTITNTTSGENETILEIGNTTMLNYTFSIDLPDPDSNFTVTVIPINGARVASQIFIINRSVMSTTPIPSRPTATSIFMTTHPLQTGSASPHAVSSTVSPSTSPSTRSEPFTSNVSSAVIIAVIGGLVLLLVVVFIVVAFVVRYCTTHRHSNSASHKRLLLRSTNRVTVDNPYETHDRNHHVAFDGLEDSSQLLSNDSSLSTGRRDSGFVSASADTSGEKELKSMLFNEVEPFTQELDEDNFMSEPQVASDDNNPSEIVFPQLQRSSSQPNVVSSTSEKSQPYSEFMSDSFMSRLKAKEKRQCEVEERKPLLCEHAIDDDETQYVQPAKLDDQSSIQSVKSESINEQPKEPQYAVLDFKKKRPKPAPQMEPSQYATISAATHERTYGNVGDQKRQAKIHGVPSDEDISMISHRAANKWIQIGLELGVDSAELDQISSECGSDQSLCCSELFRKWSTGEITASSPLTWKTVIETLDSESVGESSLARDLESKCLESTSL